MNILLLCNKHPYPAKDGGAIATLSMIRGFAAAGHAVSVLYMNTLKHHFDDRQLPGEIKKTAKFYGADVPAPISFTAALSNLLFSSLPYNAARFISNNYKDALAGLLKDERFDIVQLEGLYLCPYIDTVRKYSDAKISFRAHNIEHEIWSRVAVKEKSAFKKIYLHRLVRRLKKFEFSYINQYDFLIPITKRDHEAFRTFGNTRPAFVAPAGIDPEVKPKENMVSEFPGLFHIGSLDWAPNQEGLVWYVREVWPELLKSNPGLSFHVAGRNAPEWLARILLESEGINFLGEINDAHGFIASHSVMIAPLFSGSGMRIKIIEGMAAGKAIITTSIGTEGIDSTHGENILIADDASGFLNCIKQLISDRNLADKLGTNARMFVGKNFNSRIITRKLLDFYIRTEED